MGDLARILIVLGVVFLVAGFLVMGLARIPWLGRLPGDLVIRRQNVTFYFPLMTSLLISLVLSFILFFINKR